MIARLRQHLTRRRGQQDRHDELRVLHAIRVLRPRHTTDVQIARLAGISVTRTRMVLARLETAGELVSAPQTVRPVGTHPGPSVYRIVGPKPIEVAR